MGDVVRLPAGWALEEVPDPAADTEALVLHELELRRLHNLLYALPEIEQRVVRWYYGFDGEPLTLRRIAAQLGVSVGTAHTIKERALDLLRGQWRRAA